MPEAYLTVLFVALVLGAMLISRVLGYGAVNPITVHASVWGCLVGFYMLPGLDLSPMVRETWCLLFVSTGGLVLGSLHAWLWQSGRSWRTRLEMQVNAPPPPRYAEERLNRYYLVGLAATLAFVIMRLYLLAPLVREYGGWTAIAAENGSAVRMGTLDSAIEQGETRFTGASARPLRSACRR